MSWDIEQLEAFAAGTLSGADRSALEAHLAACPDCRNELSWLEHERALFVRRAEGAAALPAGLWAQTEARISAGRVPSAPVRSIGDRRGSPPPVRLSARSSRWAVAGLTLATAAAAGWLLLRPVRAPVVDSAPLTAESVESHAHPRLDEADAAIANAEESYRKAARLLEAEYIAGRRRLAPEVAAEYDGLLEQTRVKLALARHAAGKNPEARVRVLDGYAQYIHTLQNAVYEIPEGQP